MNVRLYPPTNRGILLEINFVDLDDIDRINEILVKIGSEPKIGQTLEEKIEILKQFGFKEMQ